MLNPMSRKSTTFRRFPRSILKSRFANVVCVISSTLNVVAIVGLIVALIRIHNSTIPGVLLATALCCTYAILPGWYLTRALRINTVQRSRIAGIILKVLCVVSAFCIVLVAMVLLGVIGAHDSDFPGAALLAALGFVAVFSFLPFWYLLYLLFGGNEHVDLTQ